MIRTNTVELKSAKGIAYRNKLHSGGSGIVVILDKAKQPGIASISKKTGEAIPTANTPKEYTQEIFKEAMELTIGLPFRNQVKVVYKGAAEVPAEEPAEEKVELTVKSEDYAAILNAYIDKTGKFSYTLFNKDLIKFAHSSSKVRSMLDEKASVEKIRLYVVGTKFRNISGNKELSDAEVRLISELLDEIQPKGIFKEFNDKIRADLRGKN